MLDDNERIKRLHAWFSGDPQPPSEMEIHLTSRCNLRCLSCVARGRAIYAPEEEERLTSAVWVKVVEMAAELGIIKIHFSGGGEPLMKRKSFYEAVKAIKKRGIQGSLVTNGMLFDDNLIKSMVQLEWDSIMFSIDGADAETHDYLRQQKGSFKSCTRNIARFASLKKQLNVENPSLVIAPVLSSKNAHQLCAFLELAGSLGASEVLYQPITIADRDIGGHLLLTRSQMQSIERQLPQLRETSEELDIRTNLDYLDSLMIKQSNEPRDLVEAETRRSDTVTLMNVPCFSPWFHIGVRPDGSVSPCGVDPPEFYGNVLRHSLEDIWYGEQFCQLRKQLIDNQIPTYCNKCCSATIMGTRAIKESLGEAR